MLDAAEAMGELANRAILAASSENTGTALARIDGEWGYEVANVMEEAAGGRKAAAYREV